MKLWNGRFSNNQDEAFDKLNASLPFDQQLAEYDVSGSIAWAKALGRANLLTKEEVDSIVNGLQKITEEFISNTFIFQPSDEDIHTAVERRLTEIVGPLGGKLHTGRSRNDQVATDFRMWLAHTVTDLIEHLRSMQRVLINRAELDFDIIIPGYTHTQQAQPILLSHWWLSFFWPFNRDRQKLENLLQETLSMPLGSGALAGSGFNIDRFALAKDLGFHHPSPNSIDAVSDRDFAAEFLFISTLIGVHLSRMAEVLILFSTREFGYVTLSEQYSTGSSLMPQKKNPDSLELIRAKCGMLIGKLTGLMSTLKGLPSAYDKDLQEDKPAVFEAAEITPLLLQVMGGVVSTLTVNSDKISKSIDQHMLATDLADYLVEREVPFRQAHSAVANAVTLAEKKRVGLSDLKIEEWREIHPAFDKNIFGLFDIRKSIERRSIYGGTAPSAVKKQLQEAKKLTL
jgi:argininosuccinate lyase